MSLKITYLLGAGASAGALPTVKDLPKHFRNMSNTLNGLFNENINIDFLRDYKADSGNFKKSIGGLANQFNIMADKHTEFITIDTYAKFLYLKNEIEEYNKIKRALSIFFVLSQLYFRKPKDEYEDTIDNRYLSFIVSLMEEGKFPEDIRILSWNYDFQFQLATEYFHKEIIDTDPLTGNKRYHHDYPKISYFPNAGYELNGDFLTLYHINGIAGLEKQTQSSIESIFAQRNKDLNNFYNNIFSNIYEFNKSNFNNFKFAWERKEIFDDIPNNSLKNDFLSHIKQTEILVVIGYSFPFFNRVVDRQIFNYLDKEKILRKIYIQNPIDISSNLYTQFDIDKSKIQIEHYSDSNNFFIPPEY